MTGSRRKQYVEVLAAHQIDGTVQPRAIILAGGDTYQIDEVTHVYRPDSPLAGPGGLRDTIRIGNHTTHLYERGGRWFVEMKE